MSTILDNQALVESSRPMAHSDQWYGGDVYEALSLSPIPTKPLLGSPGRGHVKDTLHIDAAIDMLNKSRTSGPGAIYGDDAGFETDPAFSPEGGKPIAQSQPDQTAYRNDHLISARERIQNNSLILIELKTNVIVKDEFTLVTDISAHMATRFSRPESSIMINLDHSACLLHAGSFEPAYILTISAIPSQLQPKSNQRNAALIQSFMADVLSVSPERGILRFVALPEENLASNGSTISGEIERLERQKSSHKRNFSFKRKPERDSKISTLGGKRQSNPSLDDTRYLQFSPSTASLPSVYAMSPPLPQPVYELSAEEKRLSMSSLLKKSTRPRSVAIEGQAGPIQRADSKRLSKEFMFKPPPIPQDTPQVEVRRRKSFLSVFRRPTLLSRRSSEADTRRTK